MRAQCFNSNLMISVFSRLTKTGLTEDLSHVNSRVHSKSLAKMIEATDEEVDALLSTKENSHEYD